MAYQRAYLVRLHPRADTLYVSHSRTVLATGRDGFIAAGSEHGLFVDKTRLLSRYCYRINDQPPQPVALSNVEQHSWLGYYISPPPGSSAPAAQQSIEVRLSRFVSDGLHEDVDLTNFTQRHVTCTLCLELDADFADQSEVQGQRQQHGVITRQWREAEAGVWELLFAYQAEHAYDHQGDTGVARIHRSITVRFERATSAPAYADGQVAFHIALAPHGTWHTCLNLTPQIDGEPLLPLYSCHAFVGRHNERDLRRQAFLSAATRFSTPESTTLSSVVIGTLEQAKQDLLALRRYDLEHGERAWTMAAGLPVYVGLFGRDTLTASWQAALVGPEMMRGTLEALPRWQGTVRNDWRDEQPGRMPHQVQNSPLAVLNYNPYARYYGSMTSSGFYPAVVAELWHWTGDEALVRALLAPALKGLRWLDDGGDLDGDGFYEYQTRSQQGLTNQGWKDSGDAIVYADGSQVEPPIANTAEQAFAYIAKLLLSEVLWWLDDHDAARRLYHEASEFKKRFNDAFWMEAEGCFAMGLDSQKRQITSVGSDTGHCLAAGIVDTSRVLQAAGRLVADDLFTGWGLRTLSSQHPAYNPFSYQRGSVWPVEHGAFALGFMRYGLHQHVELIGRALFEAAALFDFYRLPEVFSGHARDADHPFPALYPQANIPQAWSASTVFCLLQALLGLYPYAPLHLLLLDPHLPAWLPEITLDNLRVGPAVVTIRFYRRKDGTSDYTILDKRGSLHVIRQPSAWSLTASFAERLKDALTSLLPGK